MGKVATGSTASALPPIDWTRLKAEIVDKLDVAAEYQALGLKFSEDSVSAKGWRECHAAGRIDASPSAGVKIQPGDANHGVYCDHGGEQLTKGFLDFALTFGRFGSWVETIRHYAEKAGVTLGRVEFSGQKILEHIYRYRDAAGETVYGVFRYRLPNGKKDFRQFSMLKGEWLKEKGCMDGVTMLPYRLPELIATPEDDVIYIVEGEKDADRLAAEGLTATTNSQGSKSTDQTWPRDSFLPHFKGRDVIVLPDNDKPGRDHAHRVCRWLQGVAVRVRYLELPGLGPKGDVSDWFDAGHDISELGRISHRALDWTADLADDKDLKPILAAQASDYEFNPSDITLTCLNDVVPKEVHWLVPGKIPLGKISLLAGDPGLGKSFVTMDLAARLSVGGEIPGAHGESFGEPASSLIFFAEDGIDDTVAPRLIAAGADRKKIHTLESVRDSTGRLTPFNLSYLDHLDYALSRLGDCRLMVIDPIPSFIGRDTDDHRNTEIRAVLAPLQKLAEKWNVAIICVTHLTKGSSTKALTRITGSIAYSAFARTVWLVAKDKNDPKRRMVLCVKNNLAPDNDGLAYSIAGGSVAWESEAVEMSANEALEDASDKPYGKPPRPTKSPEAAAEWVKALIEERGPTASNTIFAEGKTAGFGRDQLYGVKDLLGLKAHKEGYGKDGPWVWSLGDVVAYPVTGYRDVS